MNILHVSTTMDRRGGDVQMLTTINLMRNHTEVSQRVLCFEGSALAQTCAENALNFSLVNSEFGFIAAIIKITRQYAIDVVHAHDSTAHSAAVAASYLVRNIKIIFSKKRDNKLRNNFFTRLKYKSPALKKVVCLSESIRQTVLPVLAHAEKASVLYDGIDVDFYAQQRNTWILHREYQLPEDALIVGSAGALVNQKDFFTFLKAARQILQQASALGVTQKILFVILGDGILLQQLKDFSVELGIADQVIFTGFRTDFAQVLPEFDVLMMSSVSEGVPLTLLSALAAKVPVVSTLAGGIGEVLEHKQTAMLSPIGDADALAENALLLLADDHLRHQIAEQAFRLANDQFSLRHMQVAYHQLYRDLVNNH